MQARSMLSLYRMQILLILVAFHMYIHNGIVVLLFTLTWMRTYFELLIMYSVNIARFCLEDVYENRLEGEEKCIFSKNDIDKVCSCFRSVVYNQREIIDGSTIYINAFISFSF